METAVVSKTSLFWQKIGKWQILATLLTLATFFITLHLTGDKEMAGWAVLTAATIATALTAAIVGIATFATFAAFVIIIAIFAAFDCPLIAAIVGTVIAVATADDRKKCDIRQRVVWLSFVAEFMIILLSILLA